MSWVVSPPFAGVSANTLITPNAGAVVWTLLVIVLVACGLVTAAKGRWGWLVAGIVTGGILWAPGALQPASPGSVWSWASTARHARG